MKPVPAESPTSLPGDSLVPLESILWTAELQRRPARPPDYEMENRALVALARALADSPGTILQKLAEIMLETLRADSSGISLISKEDDGKKFYWPAIAGVWKSHVGSGTPRDFGPCGDVLDCNAPLLFKRPERRYHYLQAATAPVEEGLLVPFYVEGKAIGTIWVIAHDDRRQFDAEDLRQLLSMSTFASSAFQATEFQRRTVAMNEALLLGSVRQQKLTESAHSSNLQLRAEIIQHQHAEEALQESEDFNRSIVESSPDCIKVLDLEGNLLSMQNGQALLGIEDIRPYLNQSWIEFWEGGEREAARAAVAAGAAGAQGNFVGFFPTLRGEPKWWDVRISAILDTDGQPKSLLAVSREVTARRRAELNLEFLASVSLDLVRFTGVDEMMQTVGAKIGAHLDLSLCAFVEIDETAEQVVIRHDWHREDVPGLVGVYRLADFVGEEFIRTARAGEIIVVRDTVADPRTDPAKFAALKIASFICVPLIRDGQWRFALCLYHSAAHDWREDEIELTRELTVRIWTRLERLRAEEALRESQRFLQSSLDALSGHIAVLDESGHILEVNEAWRRFADENQFTTPDYGIGSSYLQVCAQTVPQESEAPAYASGINDVIAGRRTHFEIEYPCHSPTEQRWFVMRVTRFQSPGPVRIVLVHDNCTERKLAEDSLRASEERYRTLFNSMDEGFCVIEMIFDEQEKPVDYRYLEVNPAFEKLTGLHNALGKRIREFVPDLEESWLEFYGKVARTGEPLRIANEVKPMNRWFDVYAFRIGGAESRKVAVLFNNITARMNGEQELSEKARLLDLSHDAIIVRDHEGRIRYWNHGAEELYGWTREETLGKISNTLLQTEFPIPVEQITEELNRNGRWEGELVHVKRDGQRITVLARKTLDRDIHGNPAAVLQNITDITARKQWEEALWASEWRMRYAADAARLTFVEVDLADGGARTPENFAAVMGYAPPPEQEADATAGSRLLLEHVAPADLARVEAALQEFISGKPIGTVDYRVLGDDGIERWIESKWSIECGTDGRPRRTFAINLDITQRKRVEESLHESETRFRAAASIVSSIIWTNNAQGRMEGEQPGWANFTGQIQEEYQDYGWVSAVHPADAQPTLDAWTQSVAEKKLFEFEHRLRRHDGEWRVCSIRAVPLLGEDGMIREWVGVHTDITGRKRAEVALREAKEAAEAANQSKDRFLAVLSHELRTPLTPVLMAVAALEHDPELRPDVREDMVMIKRNIELEVQFIDDLLDVSRIASGKVPLKIEPLDLNGTVCQVCAICRPQLLEQNVRLELDLSEDIGLIAADSARLQQVLWNVLRNAVKFTPEQGTIRVTSTRLGPDRCEIRVRDSGIGIPPATLPHIFDAFEQGNARVTRQFGGLGLGLTISKALVELHGGSIRAESAGHGQGATFIIELPGEQRAVATAAPPAVPEGTVPARLRLLIVEDHDDTARALRRLLAKAGFVVSVAGSVASALALAGRETFDLLVTDLGLPDGTGYDVMAGLQKVQPLPGIAMSGYGMDEDLSRSREAGFSAHLVKPVEVPKLIAAIRRVVEKKR